MPFLPRVPKFGLAQVEYNECIKSAKSPQYVLAPGASRVRRVIDVAWTDRVQAVKLLLGYPTIVAFGGGATDKFLSRALPDFMPDFRNPQGGQFLWCTQIESMEGIEPTGEHDADDLPIYDKARLSVVYEALTYGVLEDTHAKIKDANGRPDESKLLRYVTIAFKPSAEFLQLPRAWFHWVDGGAKAATDVGANKLIPSIEIHCIWRQVPVIPTAVETHIGKVNSAAFTIYSNNEQDESQQKTYDIGTLLLLGADLTRYKLPTGHSVFDITYRFKYLDRICGATATVPGAHAGHNYFLKYINGTPAKLDFFEISNDGLATGTKLFESADFTLLFKPY